MAKCYDLANNENPDLFPCSDDGSPAQCCGLGDSCVSNGLCLTHNLTLKTQYFIDGCTELNWAKGSVPACPNNCLIVVGGNGVKVCGTNTYCCYGLNDCDCSDSSQVFSLNPVLEINTALTTTSSTTIASTLISTSTTSATPSQLPASNQPTSSATSSNNLGIGLGVGLGVGIPLSVAAAGIWLLWSRKRRATPVPATPVPDAGPVSGVQNKHELHSDGVHELPQELHA